MKVFRPRSVHVRIASGCNLGCAMCERELLPMHPLGRRRGEVIAFVDGRAELDLTKDMSLETWELVKEKMMPHTENMELGGLGEPTLGRIFPKAAADIVAAGKSLFFFTNGHFLSLPRVLDVVGDAPRISVSIDAGTPEGYKRIRKGDMAKLVESVTAFRKAKPNAIINSQFTAFAENIDELPAWVRLCAELGIGRTDHDETLLMVGADHHVTDRVDQSLRFYRKRTLAAIDRAREIAEAEGLWFMAQLPPFSDVNPDAGEDDSDPNGWRRYTDFLFGDINPCLPEPGTSGSCLEISELVQLWTGGDKAAGELVRGDLLRTLDLATGKELPESVESISIVPQTLIEVRTSKGAFLCSRSHKVPMANGSLLTAADLKPGFALLESVVSGVAMAGEGRVARLELAGPHRLYRAAGNWHHNKIGTPPLEFGAMGIPDVDPKDAGPAEYVEVPKEVYVDYDGTVWSCLARHKIGDVAEGDWFTIVDGNRSYQEFLANWHFGTSNANECCITCPRRK